jgi:hypothetical protein
LVHGGVPADHEVVAGLPPNIAFEVAEPFALDDVALKGDRTLLVLGAKEERRHFTPQLVERRERLAAGIENVIDLADMGAAVDDITAREVCSKRHVHMTISLAFLAPGLVKAAVEGRLPHGRRRSLTWSRQHRMLGLAH